MEEKQINDLNEQQVHKEEKKQTSRIDEKIKKLPKKIFKFIELHPEVNAIKMDSTEKGTNAELFGMKVSSDNNIDSHKTEKTKEESKDKGAVYNEMIASIKDMIGREGNSEEVNNRLIDLLDKIRVDIRELEEKENEKSSNKFQEAIKLAGVSIVTMATGIGVGFLGNKILTEHSSQKTDEE